MASSTSATASSTNSTYKVILLGEAGVGKTSLFLRLQKGVFVNTDVLTTLRVDYLVKEIDVDGEPVRLFVHDTGGGERFRTLTANFFRNAQAVILVYNIEDNFTFVNLTQWVEECRNNLGSEEFESLVWVVVGNKVDVEISEVDNEQVEHFCRTNFIQYTFFTSAKTGSNVTELFQKVAEAAHKVHGNKQTTEMPKQHKHHDIILTSNLTPKRDRCCKS